MEPDHSGGSRLNVSSSPGVTASPTTPEQKTAATAEEAAFKPRGWGKLDEGEKFQRFLD